MNKAIYLDRDGVIDKKPPEGEFWIDESQIELLPRVENSIRKFKESGYKVFVVTNQRAIAMGILTTEKLNDIHQYMLRVLDEKEAHIDAIYFCPHEKNSCECRKPKPGMLLQAAKEYDIDLGNSWMIGDSEIDILAGKAAGCKTVFIGSNNSVEAIRADYVAQDVYEAAIFITEGKYPKINV